MQMELLGTPEQEKAFIFTIPAERGLSYNKINSKYKYKILLVRNFIDKSVSKGNRDLIDTEDIAKRVINSISDLWISTDKDSNIMGCFVVGILAYPRADVINFEAISGKFHFKYALPKVEEHYKSLGYDNFQMIGRKGWAKVMKPLGYSPSSSTIFKGT